MNIIVICKLPKQSEVAVYFVDTIKLKDKRIVNLLEKSNYEINLSSKNYFSQCTEKHNLYKHTFWRNITWLEECLYNSLPWANLELPAVVEKMLKITIKDESTK